MDSDPGPTSKPHMAGYRPLPEHLPVLLCKGLCSDSCGPAPMTPIEAAQVEAKIGRPLVVYEDDLTCSALNAEGRCDAYNVRPFLQGSVCGTERRLGLRG